jgi:hypothetical protein
MKTIQFEKGIILVDILLALSLATFFTALITESSLLAKDIFNRSKSRNFFIDSFENSSTTEMKIETRQFGNDMIEKDANVQGIIFSSVESSSANYSEFVGTPLCSVDFFNKNAVGSYRKSNISSVKVESITLPTDPLLPLTDLEIRNNIAYISTDSAKASDPDLFIIDIHNKDHPAILSSIDTGPGIASIVIAGKRIFAAAASTAAELHIIRLNNPSQMSLEKKFQLPLPYATATPPFGSSIFYKNALVYLGTERWDGDEFSIIDVNNPVIQIKIGGFETGSKVNNIFVYGKFAYIADSDTDQMRVLNLENINNPVIISSFNPSGSDRQEGKVISFFENNLSLGRTSGGFDIASQHELFVFATSSTLEKYDSINVPGGVYGIVADQDHLFLATREVDKEFRIISNKLGTSTDMSFSLPVAPQTITCDNDYLYILAHSAPVIYRISFI